ncbi:MAG: hypothetical protein J6N76_06740, partial [Lachnospiraceae bacterium]|nr:hypothetical protein [Lachnospiraceae bacterium]
IELYFRMKRDTGEYTQYYNVTEYFKVRYTEDVMYLLDYERRMEEILQPEHVKITDAGISLGVVTGEDPYISNETGTVIAFVQAGALYEYNKNREELVRIFDFRGNELVDRRTNYNEHDIRLLNIDETGAVDFVVYGYMNSGEHEGECGIDLYHYDSTTNVAKEQAFLRSTKSYQILGAGFSELLYRTEAGDFYIMVDGTLIHVDLTTMHQEELLSDMSEDQYAVAGSSRYLAWIDDEKAAEVISILDLETETTTQINADSGELLRVMAFMEDDLVYGQVKKSDVVEGLSGAYIYPMYKTVIQTIGAESDEVQKTYEKSGIYVTDVVKSGYTLYLDRVERVEMENAFSYVPVGNDTIMNSTGERNSMVTVATEKEESGFSTSLYLIGPKDEERDNKQKDVRLMYAGLVVTPGLVNITTDSKDSADKYYVYVGSRVVLSDNDLTRSIIRADEEMGIVVDNKQRYIWKRGRAGYRTAMGGLEVELPEDMEVSGQVLALASILSRAGADPAGALGRNNGESPYDILDSSLEEELILDLTGCSVSEVLYYIYLGAPVYAATGENEAVLLIGYDAAGVIIYDPVTKEITRMSNDDAGEYFASLGNVFVSYIPAD